MVFAGTPAFAVPSLESILGSAHRVIGVLTQPDRPKGRGRHLAAGPVKELATSAGLPVAQPERLSTDEQRADLVGWEPDVLVVVAYGLLLPQAVLALPRLGCLNVHPSLLPRWRGAAPIQRSVLAGDAETGITIMQLDQGLDTGPILLQERTKLTPGETSGALAERLAVLGGRSLVAALDGVAAGSLVPQPQSSEGVTYAAKLDKAEAPIDWSQPSATIVRQVNAFNPWPVAQSQVEGEQLRIFSAQEVSASAGPSEGRAPGTLVATDGRIVVQCGQGQVELLAVQRPGRKVITGAELARSRPLAGAHLGP